MKTRLTPSDGLLLSLKDLSSQKCRLKSDRKSDEMIPVHVEAARNIKTATVEEFDLDKTDFN